MTIISSREDDDVDALKLEIAELNEELNTITSFAMLIGEAVNVCARAELMSQNGAPVAELKFMHAELGKALSNCWNSAFDTTYLILLLEANIERIEEMIP